MNLLTIVVLADDGGSGAGIALLLAILIAAVIGFAFYMLPTIIAVSRHHRQVAPLAIINFFFGWTFLGWVACLAWSFQSYKGAAVQTGSPQ